ncbi:MAG: hypothetical protein JST16_03805 [Bdellovibrionales bacterium]|nr:hypothetical protein [Bdellovibrionales bacterium]
MKIISSFAILTLSLTLPALAAGRHPASSAVTAEDIAVVKKQYRNLLRQLKGVTMLSVGNCDASGNLAKSGGVKPCLQVGFETEQDRTRAADILPVPFDLDGVSVDFAVTGPIAPVPGVTVHN